jgi:DNA replication and repair protein RecF
MDMVISQGDHRYLDELIRYNHAVEQRNRMLKDGCTDSNLFAAVEMPMIRAAAYLHAARSRWTKELSTLFSETYTAIAGPNEVPELSYQSHLNEPGIDMLSLLDQRRQRDIAVRFTTGGPHRDDIDMHLSGMPMRRTASQGQCKSFTIALRLAQYEFLRRATGLRPLLLLDDIFDKLDAGRVERIISVVERPTFGQIFITDTNRTHLDEIMSRTGGDYRLWEVTDGDFSALTHTIPD